MSSRRTVWSFFVLVACIALFASTSSLGQYRGRKYKAPPPTSHIEVQVTKKYNGKPIPNAGVVFNPSKDGKDLGSLEVKTDPNGKAAIDVIPTGSTVRVQVIAEGFATYGQDFVIDQPSKEIAVSMLRPQAQVSAYEDNSGKAAERKPGVQEPIRTPQPTPQAAPAQGSPAPQF
jgi:hypothetical protein